MRIYRLWSMWRSFAAKLGAFQSRLFLNLLYFVVVAPFALFVRISRDPLRIKTTDGSSWNDRQASVADLDGARRQF